MRVVGIDGCRIGWVAVALDGGAFDAAYLGATLDAVMTAAGEVAAVGIDMPLGLVERGERTADRAAAACLGPRRASVFRVPPRAVWEEATFAAAVARCRELTGGGFSRQAWALRGKLQEANAHRAARPGQLHEVHPEVSFRAMAGAGLPYPKRSWTGQMLRRRLLADHGVALPDGLGAAGDAAPDDVLDAAAVAWSAVRIATGQAQCLPDPPQNDAGGGPIAIWY